MALPERVDVDYGGDGDGSERMDVHICKASYPDENKRREAAEGLRKALDQLLSFGSIERWKLTEWNTDFSLTCDNDELLEEWSNYRESNGLTDPGCWLLVHRCHTSVADSSGRAWENPLDAIVKLDWVDACGDFKAFQAIAVQEVFHAFIDSSDCIQVRDYCNGGNEHNLGNENSEYGSESWRSPMCVSYNTAPNGDCDNSIFGLTDCYGKPKLNNCEMAAIRESRNHFYNRH